MPLYSFVERERAQVPAAPGSGYQQLYVDNTGRRWAKLSSGRLIYIGSPPHVRRSETRVGAGGSAIINVLGASAPTADGTANSQAVASTSKYTRCIRVRSTSAASTGANTGHRIGTVQYLADSGFASLLFGWEDFQANCSAFIGMKGGAAHGDVDASSFVNCFGVGIDSGQTTWRLLHNDNADACTATDLGANFPANTDATDLYELMLWWAAAPTAINYQLSRLNTGHFAQGQITGNFPAVTVGQTPHIIANTRSGSSALDIAWSQVITETGPA